MAQADIENNPVFKQAFLRKTADARIRAGYTQEAIAALLGVAQDKYKHYEKRSYLPHYLIVKFCIATRIDPAELFGMPATRPVAVHAAERAGRRPSRQAR